MRKNNLAIKYCDTISDIFQEQQNNSESYIGGSSIRKLVRKTEEGQLIEDCLKEESSNTGTPKEFIGTVEFIPKRGLFNHQENTGHSIVLKKWHGYIESINHDEFTAVLTDPTEKTADIRASFSIDEVSEGDRDLICENALFDWVISRERKSHGQMENKDFLIFKRFPMWKKSDLEARSSKMDEFNEWLSSGTTA